MTTSQKRKRVNHPTIFGFSRTLVGCSVFLQGFVLLEAIVLFCSIVYAEPELKITLDPSNRLKVGEECTLLLEATWKAEEGDYRFIKPEPRLERLSLQDIGESNEVFEKVGVRWNKKVFRFTLEAIQLGKGEIFPFELKYFDPVRQIEGRFDIGKQEIKIVRDYAMVYKLMVLISTASLIVVFSIAYLLKKKRREKIDLQKVLTLEDRYLMQFQNPDSNPNDAEISMEKIRNDGKVFYSYLKEKYAITDKAVTSRELAETLERKEIKEDWKSVKNILDNLEDWTYGQMSQSAVARRQLHQEMIRFIEGKRAAGF